MRAKKRTQLEKDRQRQRKMSKWKMNVKIEFDVMLDIYLLISEWMRLLASRTLEVEREIDAIEIVKSSANLHHKANII